MFTWQGLCRITAFLNCKRLLKRDSIVAIGLADVNKDGKQDIVSFIVSNGKLMFYKCFTQTATGLKELSGENIKAQLMTLPKYKKLQKRSLLKSDKTE